ncbi:hypothetical protein CARUB_v10018894mg [Capsella rubella]|uniref:C2 domain-containing protein n=1 Tax=Capsella rubella TaxID=81985 RepID=R0H8A5_9BRAS|nr:protein SRC2 [Capsella rubella]EOA25549.1 hypothetical protein CARUB_v10018894mg [Capsella rubella]
METRSLELKVTSAKGIKKVSRMDVFVAVKLSGDPKCSDQREQRTQVARNSGTCPEWGNDLMKFPINHTLAEANRLVVTFKIKCEQLGGGEKDIGEVHVSVKELLDHLGNDKSGQRYVTYQIGKSKGDISFTYSFTDHVAITSDGGSSRYIAPEPMRPAATQQPVLNRPVLSQLLPSVGSFSYDHIPCHSQPPQAQPEILPPACFPGLFPPHGYPMSYIPERPQTMYPSIFPGLSCPPDGYPTPQTHPGLYPPYRF